MKTKINVDMRECQLSFLFSVPAWSFIKSAGGKIPIYLSLDSTNKRGKGKISKSSEVFFLSVVICRHLIKQVDCVTSISLLLALICFP